MGPNEITIGILLTTGIILGLLVTVTLVVLVAARRRAMQETILAQARLAYEQELRTIEAETREAAFSQISAELHDNIGQLLTVAHLHIEKAQLRDDSLTNIMAPIATSLGAVTKQLRLLSHSLNTDFIGDVSLMHTLDSEVVRLQSLQTCDVHFEHDGIEPVLSKDQRTVLFRMVQEILSNALKHASPSHVLIRLQGAGEPLLLINDDGKGFDAEQALAASHGLGLRNLLKRAQLAGFLLQIDAQPNKGSTFVIRRQYIAAKMKS